MKKFTINHLILFFTIILCGLVFMILIQLKAECMSCVIDPVGYIEENYKGIMCVRIP